MRGEGSIYVREFPLEPTLWVRIELAGYVNVVGTNTVCDIQEVYIVCVCVCVYVCTMYVCIHEIMTLNFQGYYG